MTARRNQLQYLVTVAEEGQITSAARKLNLAQPALSQAIAQLESELGIELLDRHPRGVTLTADGEMFLVKARAALAAETDAAQTGQALARAARGAIAIGFIGPPPVLGTPELFGAFARKHPDAQIVYQDLPFPRGATSDWLADVDVALCHEPSAEPGIQRLAVRVERRALIVGETHPLAAREDLGVADVLDETFVSYHREVQSEWAGFHSLDDHRGAPPERMTEDHALTSLQMLGVMTGARAATVLPEVDARIVAQVVPNLSAIPIRDADPARVSLMWREQSNNPLVEDLVAFAGAGGEDGV
jgi:DNA-binding transcriptional LysR family regulator